jgi:hypothetical protein
MKTKIAWLAGLAVAAAFLIWRGVGGLSTLNAEELAYLTSCEVVGTSSVNGLVSSPGADTYQVNGTVTFSFDQGGTHIVEIRVPGSGTIGPGKTEVVARASPLPINPAGGYTCRFIVTGAIAKVP